MKNSRLINYPKVNLLDKHTLNFWLPVAVGPASFGQLVFGHIMATQSEEEISADLCTLIDYHSLEQTTATEFARSVEGMSLYT